MHIIPTIHYSAGLSIHIIIQEMNLLHGNKFSPWEGFFVNPFGSDVIIPNQLCSVHVCISVQVLVKAHAVGQWISFAPGKYNSFINLVPIV